MPIYVYRCKHCDSRIEELRKIDDADRMPLGKRGCQHEDRLGEACEFVKAVTAANFRIDPAAG